MKIAVIGAGNWGKNLVKNFYELGVLAAVAEPSSNLREGLTAQYPQVPVSETYDDILKSDVDAVAIATPVATHHQVARDALLAGKHVFVEKPMTMETTQAEELVRLAKAQDRVLMVGHLLLYQPAVQWIKAYLAEGRLGKVHSLHQERLNLGKARSVENALWSLGVHDIAVLLHLVGSAPTNILATGQRALQPTVEDDVYLHLVFPGGVQAHLHNSWLWPERRRQLVVVGSEGMLVYDELAQQVTLHRKTIGADLSNQDLGAEVVFDGSGEPLKLELQHFLERIQDGQMPISGGESGVDVVRVIEEAGRQLAKAAQ